MRFTPDFPKGTPCTVQWGDGDLYAARLASDHNTGEPMMRVEWLGLRPPFLGLDTAVVLSRQVTLDSDQSGTGGQGLA